MPALSILAAMSRTSAGNERLAIWMAHQKRCVYCGEPIQLRDLEIDHILPASLENDPLKLNRLKAELRLSPHHDKDTIINGEKREPIVIASISLGGQPTMVLTPPGANLKGVPITVSGLKKVPGSIAIDLPSGSMILFANSFNRLWKHSVPKDCKDVAGKRISLTYRHF
jgi:hypothetical protein